MKYEFPTLAMAKLAKLANYEGYVDEPSESGDESASGGEDPNTLHAEPEALESSPPLTDVEESAIREWLAHIEEADPEIIAEVLDKCRANPEATAYFLQRAEEVEQTEDHINSW